MTDARKSRSGSYVPEGDRGSEQVKLRLRPIDRIHLDALARRWGVSRSEAVARLVEDARRGEMLMARLPPRDNRTGRG